MLDLVRTSTLASLVVPIPPITHTAKPAPHTRSPPHATAEHAHPPQHATAGPAHPPSHAGTCGAPIHAVVRLMLADTHIVPSDVHASEDHPRSLLLPRT
jgi:hypothetical protein